MSFTGAARVFNGCRALLAPAKSTAAAAPKTTATKPAADKPKPKPRAKPQPKLNPDGTVKTTGIQMPKPISPALSRFLGGASEASRVEAVQKVWQHIKLHNLQNPNNKREIFCDEKLKIIFSGKDKIGFLEIAKLLSPHFTSA